MNSNKGTKTLVNGLFHLWSKCSRPSLLSALKQSNITMNTRITKFNLKKKTFAYDQRPKRCNITELSLQLYTGAANLMCHFIIINVIRRNPGSSFLLLESDFHIHAVESDNGPSFFSAPRLKKMDALSLDNGYKVKKTDWRMKV